MSAETWVDKWVQSKQTLKNNATEQIVDLNFRQKLAAEAANRSLSDNSKDNVDIKMTLYSANLARS